MSDKTKLFFAVFQNSVAPQAAGVVVIALVLALLSLILFVKLKRARTTIQKLGKRLGYDPPFGDGADLLDQEDDRELTERERANTVEELEQRIVDMEAAAESKDAELASHQKRWKELEGRLAEARVENEKAAARADELVQAHHSAVERYEQNMRAKEAESQASLAAVQERSKELEDQLQQASVWGNKVTTMANEQAQAHRTLVEQLEERMREMESAHVADLTAYQRRTKELEERLHLTSSQQEQVTAQASEQVQTHQLAVMQLEQRIRQMEVEGQAYLSALEHHAKELEEQLQRALAHNEQLMGNASTKEQAQLAQVHELEERIRQMEAGGSDAGAAEQRVKDLEEELRRAGIRQEGITAQANEQTQTYRTTIENLEQRIRDMEAEGIASSSAILQRSKELEEQLRRAYGEKDAAATQVAEQAHAHQAAIEHLEERIRQMETDGISAMSGLERRSKELEEQLGRAQAEKEAAAAQIEEQTRAHQLAIEQLEARIQQMETEGSTGVVTLQQHTKDLEEQRWQAQLDKNAMAAQLVQSHEDAMRQLEERIRQAEAEGAMSGAAHEQRAKELEELLRQAQFERDAVTAQAEEQIRAHRGLAEKLEERLRELEAEKEGNGPRLQWLEARVKTLEEQLQASHPAAEAPREAAGAGTAAELLRRAEWIVGCAVGAVLPHGLVAAEAYAAAALADDPQNSSAAQLTAELARIHRAFREGLPPVAESIANFEQRAAAFFAADPAKAAEVTEDEARRRARAGLNRSALLAAQVALELQQKTNPADSPAIQGLHELKATLVERLGADADALSAAVKIPT